MPVAASEPQIRDHVALGLEYARDVVVGRVVACKWVRLACKRQLDDLERAEKDPGYPWRWDPVAAGRPCRFMEFGIVHIKGPKAGQPMLLEPWQCFAVTTLYGWQAQGSTRRRFRRAYWEVPRGNGKTFLGAGLALYSLAGDDEGGAEVYSAAVSQEQARLSFEVSQAAMRHEEAISFREKLGIEVGQHAIVHPKSSSFFKPLSSEHRALEGKNIHFGLLDEVAVHPSRAVHDSLVTALSKRTRSILLAITTAGVDIAGIGYELRGYAEKVLDGRVNAESFFALVYTIDEGDDWTKPASWKKANPNLGISTFEEYLASECDSAKAVASQRMAFLTRYLNVWQTSSAPYIAMEKWAACGDAPSRDQLSGDPNWQGVDLASKSDLASRALVFRRMVDGVSHFYGYVDSYLNDLAVRDSRNASYRGWAEDGHLIVTPGDVTDHGAIEADIASTAQKFQTLETGFDPWQAVGMMQRLDEKGVVAVEVRPIYQNLSAPMKELEALVLQGRFHHDGNPVTAWAVGNARVREDGKGNILPAKEKPDSPNKIDPLVALLTALARALVSDESSNPYLSRGFLQL